MNVRALGLAAGFFLIAVSVVRASEDKAASTAVSAPAVALNVQAGASPTIPAKPIGGGTFQIAIYFALLVSLLGGGVYVTRNGFGFLQAKPKGLRKLEISETRMLGNRQFLIVAEYEQRKMLIGVCPGRIEYLCTLSEQEAEFSRLTTEEEA